MSVNSFADLAAHEGHTIECVTYGDNHNVALECMDCGCVLIDFDNEDEDETEIFNKSESKVKRQIEDEYSYEEQAEMDGEQK